MTTIEREIVIDAPQDVVWRVVTEPEHVTAWFSDTAQLDPRPGGAGTLVFQRNAATKQPVEPVVVPLVVQEFEPPHRFSFRWSYPEGAQPEVGNSLLVEFTLTAEGGHTRLRVAESGWNEIDWTEQQKADVSKDHEEGWEIHLSRLGAHAEKL